MTIYTWQSVLTWLQGDSQNEPSSAFESGHDK